MCRHRACHHHFKQNQGSEIKSRWWWTINKSGCNLFGNMVVVVGFFNNEQKKKIQFHFISFCSTTCLVCLVNEWFFNEIWKSKKPKQIEGARFAANIPLIINQSINHAHTHTHTHYVNILVGINWLISLIFNNRSIVDQCAHLYLY